MDWQQVLTLSIVVVATALLLRGRFGRRKLKAGNCGPGCHCESPEKLAEKR